MSYYPATTSYKVKAGATWRKTFTWYTGEIPQDLTNFSGRMQIRDFDSNVRVTPVFSILNASLGIFQFEMNADVTNALEAGTYPFDIFLFRTDQADPPDTYGLIQGNIFVTDNITEPPYV